MPPAEVPGGGALMLFALGALILELWYALVSVLLEAALGMVVLG